MKAENRLDLEKYDSAPMVITESRARFRIINKNNSKYEAIRDIML